MNLSSRTRSLVVIMAGLLISGCSAEGDIALCTRISNGLELGWGNNLDVALFNDADDGELKGLVAARDIPAAISRCREIGALDSLS